MSSLTFSLIVFACTVCGALLGTLIQRWLPDHHLSRDSKDVVRLGMGLVATTLALVLGLLVASAKSFYDTQSTEMTQIAANVVLLDRLLAHYGPEAAESRALLRRTVAHQVELMYSSDIFAKPSLQDGVQAGDVVLDKLQALSPKDEDQRSLRTQALQLAIQTAQTRWLIYEQKTVPVPMLLLVVLLFWLVVLFISFGLYAPPNLTVFVSLFISAAAVCGAIFLILEMYHPYAGLLRLSDAPLRAAMEQLGH